MCLVPFGDLLNHENPAPEAPADLGALFGFDQTSRAYVFRAQRRFAIIRRELSTHALSRRHAADDATEESDGDGALPDGDDDSVRLDARRRVGVGRDPREWRA